MTDTDTDTAAAELDVPTDADAVGDQLADVVAATVAAVPDVALLADLPDALRLLGRLQLAHKRLGGLIADTERELLDRAGDKAEAVELVGWSVAAELGSLSYEWVPVREVLKATMPDLIGLDPEIAYRTIDRVEAMLPAAVKWSRPGVGAYANPDELCASKRSRPRLKVEPAAAPAEPITAGEPS